MPTAELPRPKCPECGAESVYYRRFLNSYACKRCGATWPKPPEKVKA
jgi:ribosomal protein S27E